MSNGLIHIKKEIYEPGYVLDIKNYNIYYNSVDGTYRRQLSCECGKNLGCFCFDNLEQALDSVRNCVVCNRCYVNENVDLVADIMADKFPGIYVTALRDSQIDVIIKILAEKDDECNSLYLCET